MVADGEPGDKGLTRPPASARVSAHKNEVRSIACGYFQNQFRVPAYKHVGRPTQDSQKRDEDLDKICPISKVSWLGYSKQTFTQELTRQGESIHRAASHTGPRRNPSNKDETGSVLRIR